MKYTMMEKRIKGKCAGCGRPTKTGNHSECYKLIAGFDENARDKWGHTKKQVKSASYKLSAKNYAKGKIPPEFFR